ncbi:MAG: RluA family pseudouridine synthase [Solirubrobacteraceae bacterium]
MLDFNQENDAELDEDDDKLFEHFSFTASKGQFPLRVDKFLMNLIENATRNKIQNSITAGNVVVNDLPVKANYKVKPHDLVKILLAYPPRENTVIAQNIPLDIVFEDEYLIVVNKPAGMVVHPGFGNFENTLVNALKYRFDNLPSLDDQLDRAGLVHRIDKNTSGLLIIAKTGIAMNHLAKQFFNRTIKRSYHALVWGNIEEDTGTIIGNIGRDLKDRKNMVVFPKGDNGKHAVTHFNVLERFRYITYVQCKLETGRTHQIRVHFKYKGHPLFNDERYGGDKILRGTTFTKYKQFIENCFKILPRQALHAKSLGFIHPINKKEYYFEIDLPTEMQEAIVKWREYTKNT